MLVQPARILATPWLAGLAWEFSVKDLADARTSYPEDLIFKIPQSSTGCPNTWQLEQGNGVSLNFSSLIYSFLVMPWGMRDLSSPTRERAQALSTGSMES